MTNKLNKKKVIFFITFIITLILIKNISVAASFSTNAAKTTLNVGESTKVTINGTGCYGQFKISSSDSSIVSISEGQKWIENASDSVTVTAKKTGKATITVTAASVSDKTGENEVTGSKSITINVSEPKKETPPANNNSEKNNSSNNNNNNNGGGNSNNKANSKSSDATLKAITVGGKNYSAPSTNITAPSVSSSTSSIKISAATNDSKATVTGTGNKDLVTGTNKFNLKVTAENGATKTYTITVTRLADEGIEPNVEEENNKKEEPRTRAESK